MSNNIQVVIRPLVNQPPIKVMATVPGITKIELDKVVGDLTTLKTTNKTNLVAATNEIKQEVTTFKEDYATQVDRLDDRIDVIITTPTDVVTVEEILDARQGNISLGANLTGVKTQVVDITQLKNYELQNKTRKPQPLITFWDDDGRIEVMTKLLPLSQSYHIPFCSAVFPSVIEGAGTTGFMSKEDLVTLQSNNWEILSHTYTSPHLAELTDEEQDYELRHSKELLESWGLKVNGISYPFRSRNAKTRELSRKYYRYGASGGEGLNSSPLETYSLRSAKIGSYFDNTYSAEKYPFATNTIEYYKYLVDQAYANNQWLVLVTHVAETSVEQLALIEQTIQYIQSLNIEVVTANEAINRIGNIIDMGFYWKDEPDNPHFVVGYNGAIRSTDLQDIIEKTEWDFCTASTPPNEFELGKIYHTRISFSNSTGFPTSIGLLMTYTLLSQDGDNYYKYQIYKDSDTNITWTRTNISATEWGSWEINNRINLLADNSKTGLETIGTFPVNQISYVRISTANAINMPLGIGGMLETNRLIDIPDYNYQLYHVANRNVVYKRSTQFGNWLPWEVLNPIRVLPPNSVTSTTSASNFDINRITYCEITSSNIGGFPSYGTLMTDRVASSTFNRIYQEFIGVACQKYMRYWDAGTNAWSSWKKYVLENYVG